jgi:hypothetical protein
LKIIGIENADFKFVLDEVVKTKTSDLFNEISYLSRQFYPESIISQESHFASINGEHVYDFYNDMIQSFSNRKIAQLSGGELLHLKLSWCFVVLLNLFFRRTL